MANGSIAQQIGARAQAQVSGTNPLGQLVSGVQQGAQLAQQVENIRNQREQLNLAKEQLIQKNVDRFGQSLFKGLSIKNPRARNMFMKNFVTPLRSQLQLEDVFPDNSLEFVNASEENRARALKLQAQVERGELSVEEAIDTLNETEIVTGKRSFS